MARSAVLDARFVLLQEGAERPFLRRRCVTKRLSGEPDGQRGEAVRQGFGVFLIVVGAYFIWHLVRTRRQLAEVGRWPSTTGEILESKVRRTGGRRPVYEARIVYRYEVQGRTFTGKGVRLGGDVRGGRLRAEKRCALYPVGARPTVYHDPADPATACLERAGEGLWLEALGGVFGLAVGSWLLFGPAG